MPAPKLGDFFVTRTNGWVAAVIRWITHAPVNHAGIFIGYGQVVEAQPRGATISDLTRYPGAIWSHMELSDVQRQYLHDAAMHTVGTPYNFADIAAQAIVRLFDWHAPKWAIKRLSRPDRLQCAQLVDLCYQRAGIDLFPPDRPSGLVSPGDLYDLTRRTDG